MSGIENPVQNAPATAQTRGSHGKVVDALITQGVLTTDQLAAAIARQKETGDIKGLVNGSSLVRLGFVTDEDVTRAQASVVGVGYAQPDLYNGDEPILPEVLAILPASVAHQFAVLPIGRTTDGRRLRVVAAQWTQQAFDTVQNLAKEMDLRVEPLLGTEKLLRTAIRTFYGEPTTPPIANKAAPKTRCRQS